MKHKLTYLALAFAVSSLGSGRALAQSDAELAVAQYGVSFIPQFIGKVVRGENVLRALEKSSYEAIPAAALQYAGMRMVGAEWRLAIPAQVLVQKGAEVQRRSVMREPVFSKSLLTSWELDYLGMNFRIWEGRVLPPRMNVASFISFIYLGTERDEMGDDATYGSFDRYRHGTADERQSRLESRRRGASPGKRG